MHKIIILTFGLLVFGCGNDPLTTVNPIQGIQGPQGEPGQSGIDGKNGGSCHVEKVTCPSTLNAIVNCMCYRIYCDDGSEVIVHE
jgi:hypothetical protein